MTTGFKPGGYADMIPTEVFTTQLMFENKDGATPVEYFSNFAISLNHDRSIFDDFMHDFVANYGLSKPGGTPLIPTVRYKNFPNVNAQGETRFPLKDPRVYNDTLQYTAYFVTYLPGGIKPKIFVRKDSNIYMELQQQGEGFVHEIGVPSPESIINVGNTAAPGPSRQHAKPLESQAADDAQNSQEQPQKVCKI